MDAKDLTTVSFQDLGLAVNLPNSSCPPLVGTACRLVSHHQQHITVTSEVDVKGWNCRVGFWTPAMLAQVLVLGAGGSSKQRASAEPATAGRVAAAATGGGVLAPMVGMYQQQLLDEPFALGHCSDQPRHAAAAKSSSSSSSSAVVASPQTQAHGAGEPQRLFEALVGEILQRGAGGGNGGVGDLEQMVWWVREVCVDPVEARPADKAKKRQVLALRRARYLRMEDVADAAELPSFSKKRKYRTRNNHSERPKKGSVNMPTRKSERLAKRMVLMTSVLLTQRKKIGVGEHFQAELPDWTGPPSKEEFSHYRNDPNISKMLGTRIWPPKGEILPIDNVVAGQGRPESCSCPYPGSFFCRQHHINVARDQLRSDLGRAFTIWRFDSMGEEVSKMWSRDEQLKFNALERLVPVLEHKTFWGIASKHFASKTRMDLVQYYLNVFLMRRVLSQCRLSLLEIDSDEDEAEEEEDEDQSDGSNSFQRAQDIQDAKRISSIC